MSWQQQTPEPVPERAFYAKPVFLASVTMAVILVIGIWFFVSFINIASNPTRENSINYYGMAEVLDVRATPKKCYVDIRRDDGRETRQTMARGECGKFHKGDIIKLENGQFVSKAPAPAVPLR